MAEEMKKATREIQRDEEGKLVELGKSDTHLASFFVTQSLAKKPVVLTSEGLRQTRKK